MGRLVSFYEATANNSSKDLTSFVNKWLSGGNNSSKHLKLKCAHVELATTATVGDRLLSLVMTDENGNELFDYNVGSLQAASLVYHYDFMPGIYRETVNTTAVGSGVDGTIECPFPVDLEWRPDWTLTFKDKNAVDAAADDMIISGIVEIC